MNRIPGAWPSAGDVDEDSSGTKPSPGYCRYSIAAWVFIFCAISIESAANADLVWFDALEEDLTEGEEPEVDLDADE